MTIYNKLFNIKAIKNPLSQEMMPIKNKFLKPIGKETASKNQSLKLHHQVTKLFFNQHKCRQFKKKEKGK